MVRIARDKYLARNRAETLKEALVMLITRNIALGSRVNLWKDWRLYQLYTSECNDHFEANLDYLGQIYCFMVTGKSFEVSKVMATHLLNGNYSYTNRKLLQMDFVIEIFTKHL